MNGRLLDTNHASALFFHDSRVQSRGTLHAGSRLLPLPVVGELWYMIYNSDRVSQNREQMDGFLSEFEILPFTEADAEEFGRVRAELRRKGKKIPQIDCQIAAMARLHDFSLITADHHLTFVEGLTTENWLT